MKWVLKTGALALAGILLLGPGGLQPLAVDAANSGVAVGLSKEGAELPAQVVPARQMISPRRWYTDEEAEMMAWIVQQEVGGGSLRHKQAVAEVIVNRVRSSRFPNTITEVLLAPGQFCSVTNWYQRVNMPDADTFRAVRQVLAGTAAPVAGGAVFFYAPRWTGAKTAAWFESLPLTLELEGHRFFALG